MWTTVLTQDGRPICTGLEGVGIYCSDLRVETFKYTCSVLIMEMSLIGICGVNEFW